MLTIVFYVMTCTNIDTNSECNTFEPYSWIASNETQRTKAFEECSILANAYEQLENVKEVDCYIEE